MKITRRQLRQLISEEIREIRQLKEGEVVSLPKPRLPYSFGPDGYLMKEPRLQKMMSNIEYGSDSRPEELIAIALAARYVMLLDPDGAEEDIEVTVNPDVFLRPWIDVDGHGRQVEALAVSIYKDYVIGMAGDRADQLDDIIERIGIDYFDEPIEGVIKSLQSHQTSSQTAEEDKFADQQEPEDVIQEGLDCLDFNRFLKGVVNKGSAAVLETKEN